MALVHDWRRDVGCTFESAVLTARLVAGVERIRHRVFAGAFLRTLCFACVAAAGYLCSAGREAVAGGGSETTLLVVNSRSALSLAVANDYMRRRDLPENHVLWLDNVPAMATIDVETFRRRILAPIRKYLADSGLEEEIDLIAYSAGFPYAVNFRSDERAHGLKPEKYRADAASLTGMTFFARQVEAGQVGYLGRQSNQYFSRPVSWSRENARPLVLKDDAKDAVVARVPLSFESARGFRSRYFWGRGPTRDGMRDTDRYFLSTMLAYTDVEGNSLPEIDDYLTRAAKSDGTQPDGTVYLMENRDIRSRVRQPFFPAAIAGLSALGRKAQVLAAGSPGQNGREPKGRPDIIGLVAGARAFRWDVSGSRILPGAIAESFTSYAGYFGHSSQTKLTEFLRRGAAGSSGAVREPYAFVEKFPVPQMHVYYAQGCSLAEAYYLSVLSPYQLIVVGDPLTRPFAHFATVSLDLPALDGVLKGVVPILARVIPATGRRIGTLELWVDGQMLKTVPAGSGLDLGTAALADGMHELRVVAVEAGPIETRSYAKRMIRVLNHGRQVTLDPVPDTARYGETIVLTGRSEGAQRVSVRQAGRVLVQTQVRGGAWRAEVATEILGMGPVELTALAVYPDGGAARSEPVGFDVVPPRLLSADPSVASDTKGLTGQVEYPKKDAATVVLEGLVDRFTRVLGLRRATQAAISGAFEVQASGLYEFKVETAGKVALRIGDAWTREFEVSPEMGGARIAVPLAEGWHRFELTVTNPGADRLNAQLSGPEVAFMLTGERVRQN